MKCPLTLAALCFWSLSFAVTYTSVADGNWSDSSTWSPLGIPLSDDEVTINHDVLATNIVISNAQITIEDGASFSGSSLEMIGGILLNYGTMTFLEIESSTDAIIANEATGIFNGLKARINTPAGELINIGRMYLDSLSNFGGVVDNEGYFELNYVYHSGALGFENDDTLILGELINGGAFNNQSVMISDYVFTYSDFNNSGQFIVNDSLKINQDVTNTGELRARYFISVDPDLNNQGEITANHVYFPDGVIDGSGKFCVSGCMEFGGHLNGNDYCDMTPDGECDTIYAVVDPAVTYCEDSPCAPVSAQEETAETSWRIYPNPTNGLVNILGPSEDQIKEVRLFDLSGRTVYFEAFFESNMVHLDFSHLAKGSYVIYLQSGQDYHLQKLLID